MGPARRGDEGDAPGARRQDAGQGAAQVEAAPRRRPRWVEVVLLGHLREVVDAPPAQRGELAAVAVRQERHDRVVEATAVPVQEEQRVEDGVRHRIVARLVRIGDLEALLDEPRDEMFGGSAVGLVAEHRVRCLVPGVGAGPGVLPGLGLKRLEAVDLEGRHAVLPKIFVLVVAKDDDEVRVEVVELLARPAHALDQLGAMLPGMRLALVVAPLPAHGLWPGRRTAVALRQERVVASCV